MRIINIDNHELPIEDEDAKIFLDKDILYECGDYPGTHDLHLNPERKWKYEDIEALLVSIKHK